jgi:hypothetical protein
MSSRVDPLKQPSPIADLPAVVFATFPMMLVYLCVDAALEVVLAKSAGLSLLELLEQARGGPVRPGFHAYNLAMFAGEMLLVMFFYGIVRPRFTARWGAVIMTAAFFLAITFLFLGQMINLGIYPLRAGLVFMVVTMVDVPVAVAVGARIHDAIAERR